MTKHQREMIDRLYSSAFAGPRTQRSQAYKTGVRAGIASKLKIQPAECPYRVGSSVPMLGLPT